MANIINTILLLSGLALIVWGSCTLLGAYGQLGGGVLLITLALYPTSKRTETPPLDGRQ